MWGGGQAEGRRLGRLWAEQPALRSQTRWGPARGRPSNGGWALCGGGAGEGAPWERFPAFYWGRLGSGLTKGTGPQPPSPSFSLCPQSQRVPQADRTPGGAGSGQEGKVQVHLGNVAGMWHKKGPRVQGAGPTQSGCFPRRGLLRGAPERGAGGMGSTGVHRMRKIDEDTSPLGGMAPKGGMQRGPAVPREEPGPGAWCAEGHTGECG